ncbi:MAG: PIN domain-containing protein, partial [Nitrosopumilaceae archaeon]
MNKIVLDTSVIINGNITRKIESGILKDIEIIIPAAVIDELQSQASQKRDQGFVGLEEVKKLQKLSKNFGLTIKFDGKRPTADDVRLSSRGRIDALIKDIAKENNAVLYTSDKVQALVSEAEGIEISFQESDFKQQDLEFLRFFDSETMSIHLKEGLKPKGKKGRPGSFNLVELEDKVLTREYLHEITAQILDVAKMNNVSNIEISKPGALV